MAIFRFVPKRNIGCGVAELTHFAELYTPQGFGPPLSALCAESATFVLMAKRHHFGFAKNDKVAALALSRERTRFSLAAGHRHFGWRRKRKTCV